MIKKIGILGSTGSIGTTLLKLINNDEFEIKFLSANKNYKKLLYQAKKFNVKNLIISNHESFNSAKIFNKVVPIDPVAPKIPIFFIIKIID